MKVIYISDSLGTPIHPRGIFNYSISLIEILQRLGATVDLVVEDAPGFGVHGHLKELTRDAGPAVNSMRLSEIHRYFGESKFMIRWPTKKRERAIVFSRAIFFTSLVRLVMKLFERRGRFVKNEASLIDFVPSSGEHLRNLDGFILKRRFYWSNAHRALYGLAPMPIDAQGYDLAIVDTPHFLKVVGIAPERIFSVVHDLIPLRDPTTGTNARQLFMQKLRATLALRSTLIFVSEYTQATFHKSFPGHKRNKEIILYPAIRASLLSESNVQGPSSPVGSVPSGGQAREDRLDMLSLQASDKSNKGKVGKKKRKDETPPSQQLDLSLPYFATAISDEPRKNIAILVKACKFLSGRANIVVVGMVDGNRYIKAEARKPDNIVFTGYAAESVKVAVFRGATGVVFPSFAEGFGIPVVEGAVMGVPVLCSDIPVFREVAGDNAIYFDPYDPKSLAAAIERILGDPGAARQKAELLRESVLERFSQDAMSRRLAAALADVGLAVPRSERDAPTALPSR